MATRIGNLSVGMSLNTKAFSEGLEEARRKAWKVVREIEQSAQMRIGELRGRMGSTWWQAGAARKYFEAKQREEAMYPQFRDPRAAESRTRFIGGAEIASIQQRQISYAGLAKAVLAVRAAYSVAEIAAAAWNKEDERLIEGVKSIPIIGKVAYGIADGFTRTSTTVKKLTEEMEQQKAVMASILPLVRERARLELDTAQRVRGIQRETATVGGTPEQAVLGERANRLEQIAADLRARKQAATEARNKMVAEQPEARGAAWQNWRLDVAAAEKAAGMEASAVEDLMSRRRHEAMIEMDRQRIAEEDAVASEIAGTRAESRALEMRLLKRDLDAELILIRERYRERIDEAKRLGKNELAALLEGSRDAELRLARRGAFEPLIRDMFGAAEIPKAPTIMRGVSAFESLSLRNAPGASVQQNMLKVAQDQKKVAEATDRKIQRLVDILERDDSEVVGIQ